MATKKKTSKRAAKKPAAKKRAKAPVAKKKRATEKRVVAKKRAAPKKRAVAKKAVAKKAAARKPARRPATKRAAPKPPTKRRHDRPGHLDPEYAAELREHSGAPEREEPAAFKDEALADDDLAEQLGEDVIGKATTGEDQNDRFDQIVPEEQGGPFVTSNAGEEFARGTDESNPEDAEREPFPRT